MIHKVPQINNWPQCAYFAKNGRFQIDLQHELCKAELNHVTFWLEEVFLHCAAKLLFSISSHDIVRDKIKKKKKVKWDAHEILNESFCSILGQNMPDLLVFDSPRL